MLSTSTPDKDAFEGIISIFLALGFIIISEIEISSWINKSYTEFSNSFLFIPNPDVVLP